MMLFRPLKAYKNEGNKNGNFYYFTWCHKICKSELMRSVDWIVKSQWNASQLSWQVARDNLECSKDLILQFKSTDWSALNPGCVNLKLQLITIQGLERITNCFVNFSNASISFICKLKAICWFVTSSRTLIVELLNILKRINSFYYNLQ